MSKIICLEIINDQEFIEKCLDYHCKLEGEVFEHDVVYDQRTHDKTIMCKQFYNNNDEEVCLLYRKDEKGNYEIYYIEED